MLKSQIKSLLRNKSNIIYIILIVIIFILLNISINLRIIIDSYYDTLLENTIYETIYVYKSNLSYDEIQDSYKRILISNGISTSEEEIRRVLSDARHIESVTTEKTYFGDVSYDFIYVKADDWKNCSYIKEYLDNKGVAASYCGDSNFYKKYDVAIKYSNISEIFVIFMSFIILIIISKNILRNEKKNLELLNIIGYNKFQVKQIIFFELLTLIFIAGIVAIFIVQMVLFILSKYLNIEFYKSIIFNLFINIVMILLPPSIYALKNKN